VPDQLLDTVKEEQNRAREANRTARGGAGGGGGGGRGGAYFESCGLPQMYLWFFPCRFQAVVFRLVVRVSHSFRTTRDRVLIAHLLPGRGGRGGAIRGGPGGRGRGRGQ
jgi:hypothetical protein